MTEGPNGVLRNSDPLVFEVSLKEGGKLELGGLHLGSLHQVQHVRTEKQDQGDEHLLAIVLHVGKI